MWNVTLELARGPQSAVRTYQTRPGREDEHLVTFGSSPRADVVLNQLAHVQCCLIVNDVGYTWVRDAGARPGTRVNGTDVADTARFPPGARLQLGDATIQLSRKPEVATETWQLALRVGTMVQVFDRSTVAIGRGKDVDLKLVGPNVSRQHCVFRVDGDGRVRVHDLESSNGTWINGVRTTRAFVTFADRIDVGGHVVSLAAPPRRVPV